MASATLTWNASAVDASHSAATRYDTQYRVTGQSAWTAGPSVTAATAGISGLTAGTSYDFQVRAANAVGASGWSATVTATMPSSAVPTGFYWKGDFEDGTFNAFDTHETWSNVLVNDSYFGNGVPASAIINKSPPSMAWATKCCRMIVANTKADGTTFPSGSASGTTINVWEPGAYNNTWESLNSPPTVTWFRCTFLIPDGTDANWPGKLTPVDGDGINNSWHVMTEWHGNPGGFSSGGGTGESHKLGLALHSQNAPSGALLWKPTAGGGPYAVIFGMFYETDAVQTEANGIGGTTGPIGGNVIALKYNHWYDCVWKMLMVADPAAATTGCMKWWVDGNLRVSAKLPALQAAGNGSVPAISYQAGMYRNYPTWGGTNVTNTTNNNEHIYIGPLLSGPTAASVGSSVIG